MLRVTGIRKIIGTILITNALAVFNKTIQALEKGIAHLMADKDKYLKSAEEANILADDCQREINRADAVLTKIKALVEA